MLNNQPQPFSSFGEALKKIRVGSSESSIEVSGAVEIDQENLKSYELGETRPSEDILMLLIQHFDLKDAQASELWRLAGYGPMPADETFYLMNDESGGVAMHNSTTHTDDSKIVYTDMVQVMVNNYGVIINFMQGAGSAKNPLAVARVGMSKEHAKSVIEVLKTTLDQAHDLEKKSKTQKQLPTGKNKKGL